MSKSPRLETFFLNVASFIKDSLEETPKNQDLNPIGRSQAGKEKCQGYDPLSDFKTIVVTDKCTMCNA